MNFFNARKLKDEMNVLENITKSKIFIMIVIAILFLQAIIVTHGDIVFACYNFNSGAGGGGLHIIQWLICIGFAVISNIWRFALMYIDENKIAAFIKLKMGNKEKDPLKRSGILSLKKDS